MARLRLRPLPPPATTAVAVFDDLFSAGKAVEAVMGALTPSMLEVLDQPTLKAVEAFKPMGLNTEAGALLIAQVDVPGDAGIADADRLLGLCEVAGATETYRSEDPEQAEMLLGARRMAIHALEAMGDWLLDDIAVPRSELANVMMRISELAGQYDVYIGTFGHAGDGNLHPTIVFPRGDADAEQRALAAFDAMLDLALDAGGTITGEHGVGLLKQRYLSRELDPVAIDLHPRIKKAWDPENILNPGKSLPLW